MNITCEKCGAEVTLTQPPEHSEFVPSGMCNTCNTVYVAIWLNGQWVTRVVNYIEKEDEEAKA